MKDRTQELNVWSHSDEEIGRSLSNFAHTPFTLDGVTYGSVEAFYASILIADEEKKARVRPLHGIAAKRRIPRCKPEVFAYGDTDIRLGSPEHHGLIKRALRAKLVAHPGLSAAFVQTRPRPLIHETGHPHKSGAEFSHSVFCRILTELRDELAGTGHTADVVETEQSEQGDVARQSASSPRPSEAAVGRTPGRPYRDLTSLSVFLRAGLWVHVGLVVFSLWSGFQQLDFLQRVSDTGVFSETEATALDARRSLVAALYLLTFVVTSGTLLWWVYLANHNARALSVAGMQFTPGWAVGWFFVPLANLWRAYEVLRELFKASHPDFTEDWQQAPRPGLLPLAWVLWMTNHLVGIAILGVQDGRETTVGLQIESWMGLMSDSVDLAVGLVAIALASKLASWQSAKHARLVRENGPGADGTTTP